MFDPCRKRDFVTCVGLSLDTPVSQSVLEYVQCTPVESSSVTSIFLYACESWTLAAELQRRIQAMEMRCYARYYASHTKTMLPTRKSVPRSSRAIGPHEDLTTVKRRKLQWYVHVSRSSGLARTILQGTVKGGRKQGRQRKRSEDNMREWTGLEYAKSRKAVEGRRKWRKVVAKSFVVPERP